MSASDSDYSIDWLASDEDDIGSPDRLSPRPPDAQPPPTSTTTCSRDPPRKRVRSVDRSDDDSDSKDGHRRRPPRRERSDGGNESDCSSPPVSEQNFWASPGQGYTTTRVGQQTPSRTLRSASGVIGKPLEMRKRAHSPGHCETSQSEDTDKELFSRKCMELQCYIQPLSSILRGLRSGRYSQRLSSFQESVAMDRIQRIMGVLQNPDMGERFLNIVLKMEAMLHSWFPQVKPNADQHADDVTPAKRQKHRTTANQSISSPSSACSVSSGATAGPVPGSFSAAQVRWFHASPACSLKTSEPAQGRTAAAAAAPCTSRVLQATQDNVVSSSTDLQNGPKSNPLHRQGDLPFKISSPCLQRLLQAKESIIAPRTVGDDSTCERSGL